MSHPLRARRHCWRARHAVVCVDLGALPSAAEGFQVFAGFLEMWVDLESLLELRPRAVRLALRCPDAAQQVVGFRIVGSQRDSSEGVLCGCRSSHPAICPVHKS